MRTLLFVLAALIAPFGALADTEHGTPLAAVPRAKSVPWDDSVEFGASTDSLTNGHSPSSQTSVFARERGTAGRPTYYQQWVEQNQYGFHDRSLMAGSVLSATLHTLVGVQLSLSPTHNVLPSFDGSLSVEQRFGGGFGTALAFERRSYSTVNASITAVTVDRYFGQYYVAYRPTFAQLEGTPGIATTHDLSVTRYDTRGGNVTLNWYAGRDVESTGAASVLVINVSGLSLSGHEVVAPHLAVAYGVEAFNEGSLYSATGAHLGLRYAF